LGYWENILLPYSRPNRSQAVAARSGVYALAAHRNGHARYDPKLERRIHYLQTYQPNEDIVSNVLHAHEPIISELLELIQEKRAMQIAYDAGVLPTVVQQGS